MKSTFGINSSKCEVCNQSVYPNDRVNTETSFYHKLCFCCRICEETLEVDNFFIHEEKLYCASHIEEAKNPPKINYLNEVKAELEGNKLKNQQEEYIPNPPPFPFEEEENSSESEETKEIEKEIFNDVQNESANEEEEVTEEIGETEEQKEQTNEEEEEEDEKDKNMEVAIEFKEETVEKEKNLKIKKEKEEKDEKEEKEINPYSSKVTKNLDLFSLKRSLEQEEKKRQEKEANTTRVKRLSKMLGISPLSSKQEDETVGILRSLDTFVERKDPEAVVPDLDANALINVSPEPPTLEAKTRSTWNRPASKLPISMDFPRLLKYIEIILEGERIVPPDVSKTGVTKKVVRSVLESLAIHLSDEQTLSSLTKNFDYKDTKTDLSVYLKVFFSNHMQEGTPTLNLLKAINQSIIAPAFIDLKGKFASIKCDFVDIAGTWKILTRIQEDSVLVSHSKGGKSIDSSPKGSFEFIWKLTMIFNRNITQLKVVELSITYIHYSEEINLDKKSEIEKMIKPFLRGSFDTTPASPETKREEANPSKLSPKREVVKAKSGTFGERKFINEIFGPKVQPLYFQWGKITNQKQKEKDRMLVVGNYRIYLISRNKLGKKKISKDVSLLDLRAIISPEVDKITLLFKGEFSIENFSSQNVGDILPNILINAFQVITCSFPSEQYPLNINVQPPERLKVTPFKMDQDKGFFATYRAFCDYHHLKPSSAFLLGATKLAPTKHLLLNECPGIEPNEPFSFSLVPLAYTLQYNELFSTLCLKNVPRKDAISKFSISLESNKTLRKIVLSGLEAEDGFAEFGAALSKNRSNIISELDLSNNSIKDKGMAGLAEGISHLRFLTKLNLSNSNLGPSGIQTLMKALSSNYKGSPFLKELDISYNICGTVGSLAICNFLSHKDETVSEVSLKKLIMSSCQLDVFETLKAITSSHHIETIEMLDLSYNKISRLGVQALITLAEKTKSLNCLKLNNCSLPSKLFPFQIITSLGMNSKISGVEIDLSFNNLGADGISGIVQGLRGCKNIESLILQSNNIKADSVVQLLKSSISNSYLKKLDISYNILKPTNDLLEYLSQVLGKQGHLQHFNINGCKLKKSMAVIFKEFGSNQKLVSLDISKNSGTDETLVSLAEALKTNSTLKSLKLDENKSSLSGWEHLYGGIQSNKTLYDMPTPEFDINRFISVSKDRELSREAVGDVFGKIAKILKDNQPKLTSVRAVGISFDQNPEFRESMEDDEIFIDKFGGLDHQGFFAVYDGHGGRRTVDFITKHFHKYFLAALEEGLNPKEAFIKSYSVMDQQIIDFPIPKSGSTAVTALIKKKKKKDQKILYVANIGDARAVLCRKGKAIRVSEDHKASNFNEKQRIVGSGGVVFRDRIGGSIAVSRAFGDIEFKNFGLISTPHLSTTLLTPDDTFLIIACDGLWDVISDQAAVSLIDGQTDPQQMSQKLLHHALDHGTNDNVTIMVVVF